MTQLPWHTNPAINEKRLAALRSPESRLKMSRAHKGKRPANLPEMLRKAHEANRKVVLTYSGIHAWVRRNWGSATHCEQCGKEHTTGRPVWSNKDHRYSRERSDWMMLCRRCHAAHDRDHLGVNFTRHSARHDSTV